MTDSDPPRQDPASDDSAVQPEPDPQTPADDHRLRAPSPPKGDNDAREETLWTGRTDWKHFGGDVAICVGASAALLAAALAWTPSPVWLYVLGLIAAVGIFIAIRLGLRILSTRYQLTSERLFVERGLIRMTRDQTELIRVDDVRVRKLLFDRLFNLGTVEVMSTDVSDRSVEIIGVFDADRIAEMVRTHMRSARKKSLFIESL